MYYIILVFYFIFFAACTPVNSNFHATSISCVQDEDCVLVSEGCCPCNSGGAYIAIHQSQKNSYESELRKKCSFDMMCAAWYRCGEWEEKARCINSQCSAVKKNL